ncbi:zinc finger and BTB domain-containing protein 6-like [Gouania willdenowi]|uniref:Zinc finger and BTB domain-containing protein 12 n=1 Tax=Gouania willdenowi TaxID=441366 RepID=A0A8C5N3L0_GOUWI|nr:zinc finger and BTB domain-containing protein 12 [Gouania willdenowi]
MKMVCFWLPGHGNTTLKQMNMLRSRHHFCDVTIVASNNQTFRGHKVVLAACSPFLRDQFLLNPSAKLQVSMLYSSTVVCDLLQSCYTGVLRFKQDEIVNYLTAASYFQMDDIVERCREALEKYVQLKNPSQNKTSADKNPNRPVIISGSVHSIASPPTSQSSPPYQHSPALQAGEENSADTPAPDRMTPHEDSPVLNELHIKVNCSDEDEDRREEVNVYKLYISEEDQVNREQEKERAAASQGAAYPDAEEIVIGGDDSECDLHAGDDDLSSGVLSLEGINVFKRRLSIPKIGRGRGRGRGRGFKRKKWATTLEKRPSDAALMQDMWYFPNPGVAGLDFSQEGLKAAGSYLPMELPQLDFPVGEKSTQSMSQFSLDDSSCGTGQGSSGLSNEGGDESVAVVGSTSSVAGPMICEHCGMTFPSAHSLAIHSRSTHLLYACPCCGKHFHHSSNLTRHMAVHRGVGKTHQCPLCYKTFTQKSTLIDHMNLHSGERPHRCAYCHARFAHKPALRRHLKEQHGKTTGQNSLHEQEERERERDAAVKMQEEAQQCVITEQVS